jgi:integrase
MMLVLAYCVGLRIGEIVRLNVGDFEIGIAPSRSGAPSSSNRGACRFLIV